MTTVSRRQQRLAQLKIGPRGHKKRTNLRLWDLVTDCFWCPCCQARYYQAGARAAAMQCKQGPLCPCKVMVRREEAVRAVCHKLTELIQQDTELIEQAICRSQHLDAQQDDQAAAKLTG